MTDNTTRYTIDKSHPHPFIKDLFLVLDRGQKTEAYAKESVMFLDECNVQRGYFHGGMFYGGMFRGGTFYGGDFYSGMFLGGTFHGGTFHGGTFHGGTFHGGTFLGGMFYGGFFSDGWLPLQIRGSKHFVNIPDGIHIRIGCLEKTPEEWAVEYREIGIEKRYTSSQIKEYRLYIDLATKIINNAQ